MKQNTTNENNVPRETVGLVGTIFFKAILFFALFNVFLALIQTITGESLGLYWLGESHLQLGMSNIATITLDHIKIIRGYGLFPHPNLLGAFLAFILLLEFISLNNVPRETDKEENHMFHVKHVYRGVIILGLFLTFSKAAILSLFFSIGYLLYKLKTNNVPRETDKEENYMFHVKHIVLVIAVVTLILFVSQKSLGEREFTLLESTKTNQIGFLGNGVGTNYYNINKNLTTENMWMVQPVHNLFIITLYEIGLAGLFILILIFLSFFRNSMFHVEQIRHRYNAEAIIIFLFLLSCFDHYFFTLPQGIFLFWLILAVASTEYVLSIDK